MSKHDNVNTMMGFSVFTVHLLNTGCYISVSNGMLSSFRGRGFCLYL